MRLRRRLSPSTATTRRRTAASLIIFVFFSLLRFIVIIICLSSIIAVQALAIPQSQALLKFKQSLANTTSLANWKRSTHPCSGWSGIRCLANTDIVWTLQLQGMGLTGRVDLDALVPLPRLRSISLMNNHFKGQFPRFNALGALKAIYISNNKFSGDIPDDAFAGMRSLKKVYMANNEFTGTIPSSLTYLSMLLELGLEGNRFEGQIPKLHQKQQILLRLVNVSHNRLSGPIPQSLSRMDVSSFSGNENLCGKPLDPCGSSNTRKKKKKITWKIATVLMVACIAIGAMVIVIAIILLIHSRRSKHQPDTPTRPNPTNNSSPATSCTASSTTNDLQSQLLADSVETSKQDEDDDNDLCFVSNNGNDLRFDLQQLLRAPSEVLTDVVGGSLGCNSYKTSVNNAKWLVVKRYNKQKMGVVSREEFEEHMRRLGRLNHPNVVSLVGYYYRKDEKLLLYDYVPNSCSLATYLHGGHHIRNKKVEAGVEEWKLRLKIIKGICRGLQYLYTEFPDQLIPHGHLKSSNVLLLHHTNNSQLIEPVLTDCTLAPVTNPNYIHQLMTAYRSPESSHHQQVSNKSDIWCLGTLILELLTGKFPSQLYINYNSSDEQDEEEVDLSTWVASHYRFSGNIENVLDKEIFGVTKMCCICKGQVMKLLEIGLSCCEKDVHRRSSIEQVVHKVEQLTDHDCRNLDTASSNASIDPDRASPATI